MIDPVIVITGQTGDVVFRCPFCQWQITLTAAGAALWTNHGGIVPRCRDCDVDLAQTTVKA